MEDIIKPLTIAKEDFVNNLVELINSSRLPLFIVEYILKDALNEVQAVAVRQLQIDRDKYEAEISKKQKNESEGDFEVGETTPLPQESDVETND